MATHSSVLAWRIPGTAEPGGLPSMGLQSQTRLKRLSSSSKEKLKIKTQCKFLQNSAIACPIDSVRQPSIVKFFIEIP